MFCGGGVRGQRLATFRGSGGRGATRIWTSRTVKRSIMKTKSASTMPSTLTRRVEGMFLAEGMRSTAHEPKIAAMLGRFCFQTLEVVSRGIPRASKAACVLVRERRPFGKENCRPYSAKGYWGLFELSNRSGELDRELWKCAAQSKFNQRQQCLCNGCSLEQMNCSSGGSSRR